VFKEGKRELAFQLHNNHPRDFSTARSSQTPVRKSGTSRYLHLPVCQNKVSETSVTSENAPSPVKHPKQEARK